MRLRSGHVLASICIVGLTFVAVAIVMGTSVFTGNTMGEVGMPPLLAPKVYVKENVPTPVDSIAGQTHEKVKAQDSQENAGNPVPFSEPLRPDPREDQSDALSYQSMEQLKVARKSNEIATRDNEIQDRLVTVGWITIVTIVLLTLAQLYFVWTANQHAAAAALAAKDSVEVADRALRVANRAYLSIGQWKFDGTKDNTPMCFRFFLENSGNTPATVVAEWATCDMSEGPPPRPDYGPLLEGQEINLPVAGQGQLLQVLKTPPIDAFTLELLRRGVWRFYLYGCFAYVDVFQERQWTEFSVQFDLKSSMFYLVGGQERNRYT